MALRLGSRRSVQLRALAGLVAYVGWIGGPYLLSIIVRDAAVTTWISFTSAPIRGYIGEHPLYPGERVGSDGRIVTIKDVLADQTPVIGAESELLREEENLRVLENRPPPCSAGWRSAPRWPRPMPRLQAGSRYADRGCHGQARVHKAADDLANYPERPNREARGGRPRLARRADAEA